MTSSDTVRRSSTPISPSLEDVLRSLGHDCPLGCARASAELEASVWLTRVGLPLALNPSPTLVVVDTSASLAPPNRGSRRPTWILDDVESRGIEASPELL